MISLSFKIGPVWISIIFTGCIKWFSILCIAPVGINTESFGFLKNFCLLIVISGLPCVINQCSDLWLCFCKLIDDFELTVSSFTRKFLPSNNCHHVRHRVLFWVAVCWRNFFVRWRWARAAAASPPPPPPSAPITAAHSSMMTQTEWGWTCLWAKRFSQFIQTWF